MTSVTVNGVTTVVDTQVLMQSKYFQRILNKDDNTLNLGQTNCISSVTTVLNFLHDRAILIMPKHTWAFKAYEVNYLPEDNILTRARLWRAHWSRLRPMRVCQRKGVHDPFVSTHTQRVPTGHVTEYVCWGRFAVCAPVPVAM